MLYDLFQLINNRFISVEWDQDKKGNINKDVVVLSYRFGQKKKVSVKDNFAVFEDIKFKIYDENISISEDTDFKNCVFLTNAKLDKQQSNKVRFENCVFYNTSFEDIVFSEDTAFTNSRFFGQISFKSTKFLKDANFSGSGFYCPINFHNTSFDALACFDGCEFRENVVFLHTNIYDILSLKSTIFRKSINLAYINLRANSKLETYNIGLPWPHIPSANIGYDLCIDATKWRELPKHKDIQETYRLLKCQAVAKKDNVSAIHLNQKEYEKHYLKLWWTKNIGNKLILFCDKNISNFGTSVLRVMLWFVAINLTLYLEYYFIFLYLLYAIIATEVAGILTTSSANLLRIRFKSIFSKFVLNLIIEYRYLYVIYALLGFYIYKDFASVPQPDYTFFESVRNSLTSVSDSVLAFFEHLANFFIDNSKWQDQINGFLSSFLPFSGLKDSISHILVQTSVNISLLYQVIKSFRKYSRKV